MNQAIFKLMELYIFNTVITYAQSYLAIEINSIKLYTNTFEYIKIKVEKTCFAISSK